MTVYELYDQAIKPLSAEERLSMARLILDNLVSDIASEPPCTFHSEEELEQMLLAGLNSGPAIPVTPEYWQQKKTSLSKWH